MFFAEIQYFVDSFHVFENYVKECNTKIQNAILIKNLNQKLNKH